MKAISLSSPSIEIEIEADRIEAKVLALLDLEIIDLEDYCGDAIPDSYPRYRVMRAGRCIGRISTWGERFHCSMVRQRNGYGSVYKAATCWIDRDRLQLLEGMATGILQEQLQSAPDYF